jgi:plastocyanin domain-containing protein
MEKLLVTAGGLALVFLVNWYFLFSKGRTKRALSDESRLQEITVRVKGGYDPDVIVVKKGIPVRLNFYRDENADCSEIVVITEWEIRKPLPAFKTTSVEFTPKKEGEYMFGCARGMLKGRLIVR